jgi:hypothetical protein
MSSFDKNRPPSGNSVRGKCATVATLYCLELVACEHCDHFFLEVDPLSWGRTFRDAVR